MSFLSKKKEKVEKPLQPKVVFKDESLEARVGLWSEVLFSNKAKEITNINYYDYLRRLDICRRVPIPKPLLNEIESEFSSMLAKAGVDKSETCILDNLDIDTFSFNCHLKNADRDAKISLTWGDPIEEPAHFTFEDQDTAATYDHFYFRDGRESELNLRSYTINNGERAFKRELWGHAAYFTIASGDYILTITVKTPDSIGYCFDMYRLNNESQLQEYLSNISLPTDISELYKQVRDISLGDVSDYPEISFQVKKIGNDDKEDILTDCIILRDGKIQTFTRTVDGRTVTIDKKGNWTFKSPKLSIEQDKDGKINYSLNMDSYDELVANLSNNQFPQVNSEVSEVKELTKNMFN